MRAARWCVCGRHTHNCCACTLQAAWAEDAARRWARKLGESERGGWEHTESSRVCEDASAAEVALTGLRNASALWFRDELAVRYPFPPPPRPAPAPRWRLLRV